MSRSPATVSRRGFLAGSAGAAASVLLARPAWAREEPVDKNRFALVSDIHIMADRSIVHSGQKPADNFIAGRTKVLALTPRPAAVLINGDIAFHEGLPADYALVKELLEPIEKAAIPIHMSMGNHDNRENFWAAFPEAKPLVDPLLAHRHVMLVESQYANWFMMDSLDKTNSTPGKMGSDQIAWLARELDARSDKPALVCVHHNLDPTAKGNGLRDTKELLDVIVPRKQVKAYIYGHTHCWGHTKLEGIHVVNLTALAYWFSPKQPLGWADATLRADGMKVALHCLDTKHPAEGEKLDLKWR